MKSARPSPLKSWLPACREVFTVVANAPNAPPDTVASVASAPNL